DREEHRRVLRPGAARTAAVADARAGRRDPRARNSRSRPPGRAGELDPLVPAMTAVANALAVAASIAYGAADFLGGLATKRGSTVFATVVCSQATGLAVVLLALPFLPRASPTAADLAWGAVSGLAGGIGLALLYHGLAVGVMSVVAPVTAVCAVIIPVAVGVLLGERPT